MGWEQIAEDKPLQPGDKVRLTFGTPGPFWMKAIQATAIESNLAKKETEGYILTKIDYNTPGKMVFYFDIVKTNPVIVTVLFITSGILLSAAAVSLTFEKGEQFFKTPAATMVSGGILIVAIIYLLKVLRK